MDKEKKMKRVRERDDETGFRFYENSNNKSNAKKRDLYGINQNKKKEKEKEKDKGKGKEIEAEKGSKTWDSSHIPLGVFDFPWLKDGVIYQREDLFLDYEDKFSSLQQEDAALNAAGIDFSEAFSFCETPKTSTMVDSVWKPLEIDGLEIKAEDVDCIWSSLLN